MIEPVVLKGFRDSLPSEEIPKKKIIRMLEDTFTSFGFVPIDTPVLEYTNVLLGKGGGETDKQVFSFSDNGGRDVSMRFDLTVPFARFLASHTAELAIPFKRYHINKVWRGEKPQKGRYREFIQCDFDIVGVDNATSDFEILSIMSAAFERMGIKNYTFHLSNRGLFNAFLSHIGEEKNSVEILRAVDKLRKIGREEVMRLLTEITNSSESSEAILSFITSGDDGAPFLTVLDRLTKLSGGENPSATRMKEIYSLLQAAGLESAFIYDPSITRGLDYYTGIVYETFLNDLPQLGSVCSGGRYNNLASLYTKEQLPGVGSSIGLDRLMAGLEELGSPLLLEKKSADVLIVSQGNVECCARLAAELRRLGVKADMYLVDNAKMKKIFDYAERNQIPYSLTIKNDELILKNHKSRESISLKSASEVKEAII